MAALTKRALVMGTLLLLALAGTAEAKDKLWESEKDNVLLRIPDDSSSTWTWLAYKPAWSKIDVVRGAERRLEKLKSGEDPTGQGGMMHLAIRKIDDEQTLAQSAEDSKVRDFLLRRFGSSPPEIETEESTVASGSDAENGHPCIILRAEGEAPNLRGNAGKCTGVMLITQHAGKLYLLRMYAFPTEIDQECVALDLDYMEGNALELISTKATPKTDAPPKPPENGGGDEQDGEEEEREDETIEFREQKLRLTIDKKLKRSELTEQDHADFLVIKIADSDARGSVLLYLYATPTTRYVDGVKQAPPNIVKWITQDWWANFTTTHPDGDLFTWKFPSKPEGKNPTFLTVPDMDDEKNQKGVITGKKKRPVEIGQGEAKKLGFVDKPKKNKIGKKGKGSEAMRGVLEGNRPRHGMETVLRYAWRSPSHSYRLFVIFGREGYKKWGKAIRKTLESVEFGVKFKKKRGK